MSPDERSALEVSQQIARLEKLPKEDRDAAKPDFWDRGAITAAEAEHAATVANDAIKVLDERVSQINLRLTAFEWLPKAANLVAWAFGITCLLFSITVGYFIHRIGQLEQSAISHDREIVQLKTRLEEREAIIKLLLPGAVRRNELAPEAPPPPSPKKE